MIPRRASIAAETKAGYTQPDERSIRKAVFQYLRLDEYWSGFRQRFESPVRFGQNANSHDLHRPLAGGRRHQTPLGKLPPQGTLHRWSHALEPKQTGASNLVAGILVIDPHFGEAVENLLVEACFPQVNPRPVASVVIVATVIAALLRASLGLLGPVLACDGMATVAP
jgi:hypothetical protein